MPRPSQSLWACHPTESDYDCDRLFGGYGWYFETKIYAARTRYYHTGLGFISRDCADRPSANSDNSLVTAFGTSISLDEVPADVFEADANTLEISFEFLNRYWYATSNPLSFVDPLGQQVCQPGKLPGINTRAQCIAACNAHPSMTAAQKAACVLMCKAMKTFGCFALGKYCYTLKLKKHIETCLLLCNANCAAKYC